MAEKTLTVVKTNKNHRDERCVEMLERMLALAKNGDIDHVMVIGTNDKTRHTYRGFVSECDVTLIGAVSIALVEIQASFSEGAHIVPEPPPSAA